MTSFTAYTVATLHVLGARATTLYGTLTERLDEKRRNEDGFTAIEYAIILGIVITIAIAAGVVLNRVWQNHSSKLA